MADLRHLWYLSIIILTEILTFRETQFINLFHYIMYMLSFALLRNIFLIPDHEDILLCYILEIL